MRSQWSKTRKFHRISFLSFSPVRACDGVSPFVESPPSPSISPESQRHVLLWRFCLVLVPVSFLLHKAKDQWKGSMAEGGVGKEWSWRARPLIPYLPVTPAVLETMAPNSKYFIKETTKLQLLFHRNTNSNIIPNRVLYDWFSRGLHKKVEEAAKRNLCSYFSFSKALLC